ncbi:isoaspartyl peptidase/L-asparaginase [Longimicrobium sp.]|uniref:isoaspartyl peptidase/L-asparaginase family protein n=1 Tax=Longimicrobium sp. TaxID=2029185 RepID=UPI002C817E86|nr:isoaspartyl peptidase/L-asparaginase [Longimicrobium sp.]HSU16204.1 isoaspartyl peptidase/L-asparaginase [Longimicrobium sp.]
MMNIPRLALPLALAALAACAPSAQAPASTPAALPAGSAAYGQEPRWGMVIHGGAGTITREQMTPEREAAYRAGLERALRAGYAVLQRGGRSLDAVQAAINVMEDDSLFNAGRGAVLNAEGHPEMDAAIMDGSTLAAGSVAGVHHVRNPISLARLVMEKSPHVMMIGDGAEVFGRQQNVRMEDESYFITAPRRASWERQRAADSVRAASGRGAMAPEPAYSVPDERKFGTVGAVALDQAGNLAAGTSTGGTQMKRYGRVGDAPIIGAGTYASNSSCAVSATGTGEYFIRNTVARSICALVEYGHMPLAQAADSVVMRQLVRQNGDGGIIAMDRQGNWTWPFNTSGMYRGHIDARGAIQIQIFKQ